MAQLGYGSIREQQKAERALAAMGIPSLHHAASRLRNPRRHVDPGVIDHIITAYGLHPTIVPLLQARQSA